MLGKDWRREIWTQIEAYDGPWDILVIGGGITGAGIFREAARLGLKALLVEQRDFAWGTSSRSSKLVHGGLRYLKEGKLGLMRASISEREHLLEDGPGLIDPLGFLLTIYKGDSPGRWTYNVGLSVYYLLALRCDHEYYSAHDFQMLAPHIKQEALKGGFRYGDAQTDDARLVFRVIREAIADGGIAMNYVRAENLILEDQEDGSSKVVGVQLCDMETGIGLVARARIVVNATGAWVDQFRQQVGCAACIRPLRGSHLIFPGWRLPVAQGVSFLHPIDQRPVFIIPWEGVTLVGTTDVDHVYPLETEPRISPDEVAYLMAAVEYQFPSLEITLDDMLSTYAGVRPVIGSGKENPSEESREHIILVENWLLTVTGGKMTTFRLIGLDAFKAIHHRLPEIPKIEEDIPVLNRVDLELPQKAYIEESSRRRLLGRYGADASPLVDAAREGELEPIPGTRVLWAELRWASHAEGVVHLDDLLLRRVRLGLLLPRGGADLFPAIRAICQPELGWDDARWEKEEADYLEVWHEYYGLPEQSEIPDWHTELVECLTQRRILRAVRRQKLTRRAVLVGILAALGVVSIMGYRFWRRRDRILQEGTDG